MIENDLDKVLNYMKRYVENVYEHDSEIMLNWKDIKLVLEEIERLNNIINELEKYLNEQVDYMTHHSIERMVAFDCCRHRLQELKGSNKE